MKYKITIDMDNAAFQDDDYPGFELAKILDSLAFYFRHLFKGRIPDITILHDDNGNKVGSAKLIK